MKRILGYILIIICVANFASCKTEEGDVVAGERTIAGKTIYNTTESIIIREIDMLDRALIVDQYLKTETQAEKDKLEDRAFPDHKIRIDGDIVIIYNTSEAITFNTGSRSLEELGAVWSISRVKRYVNSEEEIIPIGGFIITKAGTERWNIEITQVKEYTYQHKQSSLVVRRIEQREPSWYITSDYTVSGSGEIIGEVRNGGDNNRLTINYNIVEPLSYLFDYAVYGYYEFLRYVFARGKVDILVTTPTKTNESVKAEIKPQTKPDFQLIITYKNLTETYSY